MGKNKGPLVDYNQLEKLVWSLAEPLCEAAHAELINVEFVQEYGEWYLRIFIDREPPVDHALCETVSNSISAALDTADPIRQSYYLEVSSPGLERPLKREADFRRYAGQEILVKLYAPRGGKKEFRGILAGFTEAGLQLETAAGREVFPLDEVAKAHLMADI
jgi:ribosome maturation factor RimP